MTDPLRHTRCCLAACGLPSLRREEDDVKVDLENAILAARRDGLTTFVCGLDWAAEIWAAEIVVRLQKAAPEFRLVAAVPYPGVEEGWPPAWQARYRRLLSCAEYVKVTAPCPSAEALRLRDAWMVSRTARVLAVCGREGVRREILACARQSHVPLHILCG